MYNLSLKYDHNIGILSEQTAIRRDVVLSAVVLLAWVILISNFYQASGLRGETCDVKLVHAATRVPPKLTRKIATCLEIVIHNYTDIA